MLTRVRVDQFARRIARLVPWLLVNCGHAAFTAVSSTGSVRKGHTKARDTARAFVGPVHCKWCTLAPTPTAVLPNIHLTDYFAVSVFSWPCWHTQTSSPWCCTTLHKWFNSTVMYCLHCCCTALYFKAVPHAGTGGYGRSVRFTL